jgi:prolyl oligopeptidase
VPLEREPSICHESCAADAASYNVRNMRNTCTAIGIKLSLVAVLGAQDLGQDPNLWLEEVQGERALEWVQGHNARIDADFASRPLFKQIYSETLAILDASDRIVSATQYGSFVYNFWRDADHPRGLYRRTLALAYQSGEYDWEIVFDLDAIAKAEGVSWVYKGISLLHPSYDLGLVRLSDGGSDAVSVREFDMTAKCFVEDGFELPAAKGSLTWIDKDAVYATTDFGEGSLTTSGYPRIVKQWQRGTPLSKAKTLFEGSADAVSAGVDRTHYDGTYLDWIVDSPSFYEHELHLRVEGELKAIDLPRSAEFHTYYQGLIFVELKEEMRSGEQIFSPGTVVTTPLDALLAGEPKFEVFFEPTETMSLQSVRRTKSFVLVSVMDNVRDRLYRFHLRDGEWLHEEIAFPGSGTIRVSSVDSERDNFFLTYRSFLQPSTMYAVDAKTLERKLLQQEPDRFDAEGFESTQSFATSADGTRIPYFLVTPKGLDLDGSHPTLLYGYGGFRISMRPRYLGTTGKAWLERGGIYVVANIRGGGEFGPEWHGDVLRENRYRAFEDFEAVAEDLITRKVTSAKHLGIQGGSNGGLLVGAAMTRRPDLFGAVVCQVPLLDMRRYHTLLAGASWMAEYGNPDKPEDWAFIKEYSPYHNLSKEASYPRALFTTSTKDDRVHPAHARKMVARMSDQGHPVYYYENTEGGHAGAANSEQRAYSHALVMTYLLTELAD